MTELDDLDDTQPNLVGDGPARAAEIRRQHDVWWRASQLRTLETDLFKQFVASRLTRVDLLVMEEDRRDKNMLDLLQQARATVELVMADQAEHYGPLSHTFQADLPDYEPDLDGQLFVADLGAAQARETLPVGDVAGAIRNQTGEEDTP